MADTRMTTVVSTKGQVVLPAAVRQQNNWPAGTRLVVENATGGVFLRPELPLRPTTLDEVIGCLKYDGPPVSIAEMDASVLDEASGRYDRD